MANQRVLVDTSILIDHLRKKNKSNTVFFKLSTRYSCIISVVTEFEFLVGTTSANREYTEILLEQLPILPFDSVCVQSAVDIYRDLKSKNQLISLPDIFIAATAIANDLPLQTLNRKHFDRIEQLVQKLPD